MKKQLALLVLLLAAGLGTALECRSAVLLDDDYRAMTPGMISAGVTGAHPEYHFLPETAPKGNWAASAFLTPASQRAWRLFEENNERLSCLSLAKADSREPSFPIFTAPGPARQ